MSSNVYNKLIDRITDNYRRDENSNVSKFMKLAAFHIQENENLLEKIRDWRDIDQAEGVTLDYIGRNIGQDRDGFDDNLFRVMIKARIIRNNSDGSIPTIIRFISFILGIEKRNILVQEKWIKGEPVGLYIELDYDHIVALGLEVEQFAVIVNQLVGAGIHADIHFRGSFMFSDFADQAQDDDTHGFGEVVTDVLYYSGDFVMGDIGDTEAETVNLLVNEKNYIKGDYYLSSTTQPTTQTVGLAGETIPLEAQGYSLDEIGRGGRFGGYYRVSGFKEGTNKIIRAW